MLFPTPQFASLVSATSRFPLFFLKYNFSNNVTQSTSHPSLTSTDLCYTYVDASCNRTRTPLFLDISSVQNVENARIKKIALTSAFKHCRQRLVRRSEMPSLGDQKRYSGKWPVIFLRQNATTINFMRVQMSKDQIRPAA